MQIFVNKLLLFIASLFFLSSVYSQSNSWSTTTRELQDNWQIQSSDKVNAGDETISTSNFKPENWYAAQVPSSTLGSLVDDGVFKNVFFNRNLENIPTSMFDNP